MNDKDNFDEEFLDEIISLYPDAVALTIAGSDPSGGAGLQADLKTFQQLGVYGMSVVTLITVQNTQGVSAVHTLEPELVIAQLDAVLSDIPPRVIKTGALGNAEIVRAVGERLAQVDCPVIVDPVLVSKHGHSLASDDVVEAYREYLLPHASLITPNRFEAEKLTGIELTSSDTVAQSISALHDLGARIVLVKWGEIDGNRSHWLSNSETEECNELLNQNLTETNTHGSGCVLAATIASAISLESTVEQAVHFGLQRTFETISIGCDYGQGISPVDVRGMLPFKVN